MRGRQTLLEEFRVVLESVKARTFPYVCRKPEKICWKNYDAAQRNEYPEVIHLIARLVDIASEPIKDRLVGYDVIGRPCLSKPDLARLMLAQQYAGKCNRVSLGYMSMIEWHLGIHDGFDPSYKSLERAYGDPDVMLLLNDLFFLTQQPVSGIERKFAIDGTCFGTTIKVNWESSRDEILRLNREKGADGKKEERTRKEFAKTILAAGTTFKLISSFAIAWSPFSNESPHLKPLLKQIVELYAHVAVLTADAAFLSRENCNAIGDAGATPRIFPKDNVTLRAHGSGAWRKMLGVRERYPKMARIVSSPLNHGDDKLDDEEDAALSGKEEIGHEEGHRDSGEDRRLQHSSASLSQVHKGNRIEIQADQAAAAIPSELRNCIVPCPKAASRSS